MSNCPICNLPDGFHDHSQVKVPDHLLLPKGWLADLLKARKELVK